MTTLVFDNATEALPHLMEHVLLQGSPTPSRNGLTKEVRMVQVRLQRPHSIPILTEGRGCLLPAQIAETMWVLSGRNDVEWLSHYLPRAKDFSDDGETWRGGYGPRLRNFGETDTLEGVDQLAHVVKLLTDDRSTRRAVVNIYDPQIDTDPGKDIPCNNWLHFLPQGSVLDLNVTIRSNDLMWGWSGINAFEWTALLHVVAELSGFQVGMINFNISSLHLYERHWEKANRIAQGHTEAHSKRSPGFSYSGDLAGFDELVAEWFRLEGQIRKGGLSTALINQVNNFSEPMLRSWLLVLLAWHHDDRSLMGALMDTDLGEGLRLSPKRKVNTTPNPSLAVGVDLSRTDRGILVSLSKDGKVTPIRPVSVAEATVRGDFYKFVAGLHAEKHVAYGDSWKKRGESIGIMANIARKVDRLGVAGGGDTSADTAIDMLVYLIKYDLWLAHHAQGNKDLTSGPDHVLAVSQHLQMLGELCPSTEGMDVSAMIERAKRDFDNLEFQVTGLMTARYATVRQLIELTYPIALALWVKEENNKWHKANESRPFNGYASAGDNE
jgi:thymidylate synthase